MRYLVLLLAAAASILSITPAHADLGDELFKLLADDGAEMDHFGCSVAISGPVAIAGAHWDSDSGYASGSAYLFNATTGQQTFKLLPSDGEEQDRFGYSVAISGMTAIVGVYRDSGDDNGWAYVFHCDCSGWVQQAKLLPSDGAAGDQFGRSVAINGTTAIVGARGDDDNGDGSGSAYLFDTTTGQQTAKLLPSDGTVSDQFGRSVAISGPTAIVGAPGDGDNASGSAYLFDISDTANPTQIAKLLASDGEAEDEFGVSVAISGTTAIVGAMYDDDSGISSGSAYLFDTTTGQQLFKLLPSDGEAEDWFGLHVAISGTTAIIGAYGDDDNGTRSGSAYLFDTTTGQQLFKLLPSDGESEDQFGRSVAINGTTAIVGAFGGGDNGYYSGSAYLFDAGGAPCPGDMDGDNDIDQSDLGILLASYLIDDGGDLDGDGDTDQSDLGILLAVYGLPCP